MASDKSFVEFIADQAGDAGDITFRKMFGDYALYCNDKVVALICNNQLFVKPTEAGKKYVGEVREAPAFPGAKCSYLIEEKVEDRKWLSALIRITCADLPEPKPKKRKVERKKSRS